MNKKDKIDKNTTEIDFKLSKKEKYYIKAI